MSKRKIIVGIGFNPFVTPNASMLIKIDEKLFTLVGKESRELAPYPCMNIDEKHLLESLKSIIRELENAEPESTADAFCKGFDLAIEMVSLILDNYDSNELAKMSVYEFIEKFKDDLVEEVEASKRDE